MPFCSCTISSQNSQGQNYFNQPNGDVGIGILPTTILHVFKTASPVIKLQSADGQQSHFRIGESDDFRGGFVEYDGSVNTMFLGVHSTIDYLPTSDVRVISIRRTNGHVGINEALPASLFSVGTGSLFEVNSSGLMFTQTGTAALPSHSFVGDANTGMFSSGADAIDFTTGGINRVSITSAGNVGIGTVDTKGYRLAVNGEAIATRMVVKQYNAWPDYVFHKKYKLRSLNEVEKFIH